MDPKDNKPSVRARLLEAGVFVISEKGFDGASVREICARAETSSRMIHHYFGSKQGLLDAIVEEFSHAFLDVPMRILGEPASDPAGFASRFEILVSETLHALMRDRAVFEVIIREQIALEALGEYYRAMQAFLETAKDMGFLRGEIDTDMLTGMVIDRVGNQVLYAEAMLTLTGRNVFTDDDYRRRWVRASADLMLHGMMTE